MNAAAERLTGYKRADLIGKVSITTLHEPSELTRRSEETLPTMNPNSTAST